MPEGRSPRNATMRLMPISLVGVQHGADVRAGGADAGQVRRGVIPFGLDLPDGFHRSVLRGTARAERDGKKFRLQGRKLLARGREFLHPFRSLRREKFETEKSLCHGILIVF